MRQAPQRKIAHDGERFVLSVSINPSDRAVPKRLYVLRRRTPRKSLLYLSLRGRKRTTLAGGMVNGFFQPAIDRAHSRALV